MQKSKLFITSLALFAVIVSFGQLSAQTGSRRKHLDIDLLILGGTVVTMDQDRNIIGDGAIAIKDGKILGIGKAADMRGQPAKRTINAAGKVIIPGLINTHTHIPMTLFRRMQQFIN